MSIPQEIGIDRAEAIADRVIACLELTAETDAAMKLIRNKIIKAIMDPGGGP